MEMSSFESFISIMFGVICCELFTLCVYTTQIRDFLYKRFRNDKNS